MALVNEEYPGYERCPCCDNHTWWDRKVCRHCGRLSDEEFQLAKQMADTLGGGGEGNYKVHLIKILGERGRVGA